ncbi:hypothetical protein DPX16_18207 [Anabarilius grahami]|uniref:Uncharacterized protein n=1 Tax=Anabarilius grahami TaxID=495550 RepID=A0A3N0Y7U7_ANAGA|nr:hypothetical protein DPX16_18207 [Anabarilius grahami]
MDETRCPAFGVYASCPKLFLGRLVGPYAYVYGSCPCRQNQRQMPVFLTLDSFLVDDRLLPALNFACVLDYSFALTSCFCLLVFDLLPVGLRSYE